MTDQQFWMKADQISDSRKTIDEKSEALAGDIILYQGDKVTVYYAPNTYTFTKLGHINGATAENTKAFLGDGDPVVE